MQELEQGVTHGHNRRGKRTRTYRAWHNMKNRCLNKNVPNYSDYGGRGITICEKWMTFAGFLEDMGECPKGMMIERVDNDLGYSVDNCRWANRKDQNKNKRSNVVIEIEGVKMTVSELAEKCGIKYATLRHRIVNLGIPPSVAATGLDKLNAKKKRGSLQESDIKRIRDIYTSGNVTQAQIGDMFNVSQSAISRVLLNQTWQER